MKKIVRTLIFVAVILSLFCTASVIGIAAKENLTVSSVSVSNTDCGVYIKWTKCKAASCYKIYRKTSGESFTKIAEVEKSVSLTDSSAVSGKNYTYKVIPCLGNLEGKSAKNVTITYLSVPTKIKAKNSLSGVDVSWQKVNGADRYTVYRKIPSDKSWTHLATVKNGESYKDKKVKNGTTYSYTVIARSGSNKGSFNKNGVSVHYLSAPALTKIHSVTNGIALKWSSVSGAEKYIIYRKTASTGWTKLTTVSSKKLKYTDSSVKANTTYKYTVRAVKGNTVSGFNSGLSYRYIPVVKITDIENINSGHRVTWQKSAYATSYKVYRKISGTKSWTRIAVVKGKNTLSYTDKTALSGKTYAYTVISVAGKYQSTYDPSEKSNTYVAAPEFLSVTKTNGKNIIKWAKVKSATHYFVYRKNSTSDSWTRLSTVGNTDNYTDPSATKGKVYLYAVKASINKKLFSALSKTAKSSDVDPSKKMVALTYDDGPSNNVTNRILDVLEKYDARATFFVIGSRVDSYSKSMIRAYKMGCEIGNHTYTHINLPSYSNSSISDEVNKTNAVIKKYIGIQPTIIRAPGGSTNQRVRDCVDMPFIYWSVDTRDWEHRNSSKTISHIKNNVRDGSIVLMHDIYPATATASETIIPWLIDKGYQLVTVSELMEYRNINMKPGYSYTNGYKK